MSTAAVQVAPGELELVQQFVNTNDVEDGIEKLASPALLSGWLAEHGLEPGRARFGKADVERAIELREALRALLLANNGETLDPEAVGTLNSAAARAGLQVHFGEDGGAAIRPRRDGLDGALGAILAIVYRAMAEGTWPRLKACRSDTCQWAFYDKSKNRSGHWCTMAVCGNRAKARAYRRRHKSPAGPPRRGSRHSGPSR
jgi:predicted RNA-binding Zn ribbon-like protein